MSLHTVGSVASSMGSTSSQGLSGVDSRSVGSAELGLGFIPQPTPIADVRAVCVRICVWGLAGRDVRGVWPYIWRALPVSLHDCVRRIVRVRQPNGVDRHDVYVLRSSAEEVVHRMQKLTRCVGWHVRGDLPWRSRVARCAVHSAKAAPNTCTHTFARLLSLNVCHLGGKRTELELHLQRECVTIAAIQETWRREASWRLRVSGYAAVERVCSVEGSVGVALLAAAGTQIIEVGAKQSPFFVFARISEGPLPCAVIAGSVYLPGKGPQKRQAMDDLVSELQNLRRRFPGTPIIAMGDFNKSPKEMTAWIRKSQMGFVVKAGAGAMNSVCKGGRAGRAIDHMLVSMEHLACLYSTAIDRTCHMSDHWPIHTTLNSEALRGLSNAAASTPQEDGKETWRFVRPDRWQETYETRRRQPTEVNPQPTTVAGFVVHHNAFSALADVTPDSDELFDAMLDKPMQQQVAADSNATTLVNLWNDACMEAAADAGIRVKSMRGRHLGLSTTLHPRDKTVHAIDAARAAYASLQDAIRANRPADEVKVLEERFQSQRKASRVQQRRDSKAAWETFVARSAREVLGKPKRMWDWAKRVSGMRPQQGASVWRPLWDPADPAHLVVEPEGITKIVVDHYASLAEDPQPMTAEQWESIAGQPASQPLPGLIDSLTWPAVVRAIADLKLGRAAGADELPSEWYKLVLPAIEEELGGTARHVAEDAVPNTPMAKALFRVLQRVWDHQDVPADWLASILVPIDKKGDVLDITNQRGISLMSVALKILCVVAARNLQQVFEDNHVLRKEQAGFRPREECLGHVCALWEILARRRAARCMTVVSFIDFKTAFDTVPHEALLARLRRVGVSGRVYEFIAALYRGSTIRVRLPDGSLSVAIDLGRGVRQGCPLSPILFDLYIDTLFDEWVDEEGKQMGVTVPGVPESVGLCPGTLFADDTTCLFDSPAQAGVGHKRLSDWATKWHMRVNANKCGCMIVVPMEGEEAELVLTAISDFETHPEYLLVQGAAMPLVDKYTYLGVVTTDTLDLDAVIHDRVTKGSRALATLAPFLRNQSIPLFIRATVYKATVCAVLLYAGELWGGSTIRCAPIQTVMNRGLRMLAGCKASSTLPALAALYREFKCPPVAASALARRCRAFLKYGGLSTWIAVLVMNRNLCGTARKSSWVCGSAALVTKHDVAPLGTEASSAEALQVAVKLTKARMWDTLEQGTPACPLVTSARPHIEGFMALTRLCRRGFVWLAPYGADLTHLLRARVGAYATGTRDRYIRAAAGVLSAPGRNVCEFCDCRRPETLSHLLVTCKRWQTLRRRLLGSLIVQAMERLECTAPGRISPQAVATLLLGGAVSGIRLHGWDYVRELADDTASCVSDDISLGDVSSVSDGSPVARTVNKGAYMVAEFLRRVNGLRRGIRAGR
jgi:exonuclease III